MLKQRTSMRWAGIILIALVLIASCTTTNHTSNPSPTSRQFTDEAGRTISVPARIDRFITLAPNLTEIVFAIGAGDRLVGNTTYCDYPAPAKQIEKVGDTLRPSMERIIALRPQLVLVSTASQLETFTTQLSD
ncbi:MAG TPA: helical backbone metal receptor, partial [Pyrinomonadaceae bacterium]